MVKANAPVFTRFAKAISRLHWGRTALTQLVQRLAHDEWALAQIVPLDVCSVFAGWARRGYRVVPPAAERFSRDIRSFSLRAATRCKPVRPSGRSICSRRPFEPTDATIDRLLRPYEGVNQREVERETRKIEGAIARRTRAELLGATATLTRTLALDPSSLRLFAASLNGS